jgi:hypothetical protein
MAIEYHGGGRIGKLLGDIAHPRLEQIPQIAPKTWRSSPQGRQKG